MVLSVYVHCHSMLSALTFELEKRIYVRQVPYTTKNVRLPFQFPSNHPKSIREIKYISFTGHIDGFH